MARKVIMLRSLKDILLWPGRILFSGQEGYYAEVPEGYCVVARK